MTTSPPVSVVLRPDPEGKSAAFAEAETSGPLPVLTSEDGFECAPPFKVGGVTEESNHEKVSLCGMVDFIVA